MVTALQLAFRRMLDRIAFRMRAVRFGLSVKPIRGGSPEGDGDGGEGGDAGGDEGKGGDGEGKSGGGSGSEGGAGGGDGGGAARRGDETDWKAEARKHEQRTKRTTTALGVIASGGSLEDAAKAAKVPESKLREWLPEDVQQKIKEREDAEKTEQQKAIDDAREEAKTEAQREFDAQRRADRLEVAVTRHAARGFEVGEGDDAKTVKYADPDDAIVHLERALDRGELDNDELFDSNGRVKDDELKAALAELVGRKPHLADNGTDRSEDRPQGSADAGRGSSAGAGTELEEMTPDDHLKVIQKR